MALGTDILLGTTIIQDIPSSIGGGIAFHEDDYFILDRTPATPRIIRVGTTSHPVDTAPFASTKEIIQLPSSGDYYGIAAARGSIVVLSKKIRYCENGDIAIGELITVDVNNRVISGSEEIRARERISLIGGFTAVGPEWIFLAENAGNNYFYKTRDGSAIDQGSQFTLSFTGRRHLGYDSENKSVLVVADPINPADRYEILAYDDQRLVHKTAAFEDISLTSLNPVISGVVWTEWAWTSPVVGVLDYNTPNLPAIRWYGTSGSTYIEPNVVSPTTRKQLKKLRSFAGTFEIEGITFRGRIGRELERVAVPGAVPNVVELERVRITPEFILAGVRTGMEIQQQGYISRPGNPYADNAEDTRDLREEAQNYEIRGIDSTDTNRWQSFVCAPKDE